ncbi:hypothetical protein DFH07DRAFT_768050 [Mycena maculata]|uniref:Uncharacterized protein n=1 Tax=Mycena maculata TaxID=230809 RepID=A0AAD7NRA4_9AGAR|nr:hypothetical protein DFH07DRAFT_768050 [Mycena maculata]
MVDGTGTAPVRRVPSNLRDSSPNVVNTKLRCHQRKEEETIGRNHFGGDMLQVDLSRPDVLARVLLKNDGQKTCQKLHIKFRKNGLRLRKVSKSELEQTSGQKRSRMDQKMDVMPWGEDRSMPQTFWWQSRPSFLAKTRVADHD